MPRHSLTARLPWRDDRRATGTRGVPGRRGRAVLAALLLLPAATGCYSYRTIPATTANPGTEVALLVTDDGRVALGQALGPGALRVMGQVAERSDSGFVIRVSAVDYLDNRRVRWSGEPITVASRYIAGVTEKRFSRGRTWLTAGLTSAALVALAASVDLFGGGTGEGSTKPPPDGGAQ